MFPVITPTASQTSSNREKKRKSNMTYMALEAWLSGKRGLGRSLLEVPSSSPKRDKNIAI